LLVFVPIFRQHAALIKRAFQDISPEEQRQMEEVLERIGKRAEFCWPVEIATTTQKQRQLQVLRLRAARSAQDDTLGVSVTLLVSVEREDGEELDDHAL
jgi:hypothetical protein